MAPIDASGEELEAILKALPTIPGGVSVTREVSEPLVRSGQWALYEPEEVKL